MPVTREDVVQAYRLFLGRDPESEQAILAHLGSQSLLELARGLAFSPEFAGRHKGSPLYYFNGTLEDPLGMIRRYENPDRKPRAGHVVNYLGVATDIRWVPEISGMAGVVEGVPIPGNWHADIAEWAAVIRAVELASRTFTVAELGCGWGCWMNNSAAIAKRRGLKVLALGIEAQPDRLELAKEACATNGLFPAEYRLHLGMATAQTFGAILAGIPRVDLLHFDIQGAERELVHSTLRFLRERVAYLVIGTHSRQIEGSLIEDLMGTGWELEIERPAIPDPKKPGWESSTDGVQGWRNPALTRR